MTGAHAITRQKALGAFYTPEAMAAKLVAWAVRSSADRVIDPSFGGFVFLELAKQRLLSLGDRPEQLAGLVYGVDLDDEALRVAREDEGLDDVTLLHSDFFDLEPENLPRFTANIGNPPYIRYQSWNGSANRAHLVAELMGVKMTKLASIWAPFIVHGCRFLEDGGRMAQVLPAELLHSQYARPVTDFLTQSFRQLTIALFDERVFPGALEEVVLLFADGYQQGPAPGIGIVSCRTVEDLDLAKIDGTGRGLFDPHVALLRLLPTKTQRLYERLAKDARIRPLQSSARVDIGAVTGANKFFIRSREEIRDRGFDPALFQTIISKAADLKGGMLNQQDIDALVARSRKTELLVANGHDETQLASIEELIQEGEQLELHQRYKCRVRSPWWAVPLPRGGAPDAFLTYMSDAHPRLVHNRAKALSTNTIHGVTVAKKVSARALTVAFYNSLTLLSAELVGRSYGGGILKLEPTEAERLLFPPFAADLAKQLPEVDRLLRAGELDAALDLVDPIVLEPLGVSTEEIALLRGARRKLLLRRRRRSKK